MRPCQKHWDALRKAVDDRGMTPLVAKSGEQAAENIQAEIEGGEAPYDPLMSCFWMVSNEALRQGGIAMMMPKDDGSERCPICEAVANGHPEAHWVDGPADAALARCRELGLLPKVQ